MADVASWPARKRVIGGSLRLRLSVDRPIRTRRRRGRRSRRNRLLVTGGKFDQGEDLVDPLPAVHRVALADEVRLAGRCMRTRSASASAAADVRPPHSRHTSCPQGSCRRPPAAAGRTGPLHQPRNEVHDLAAPRSGAAGGNSCGTRHRREPLRHSPPARLLGERFRVRVVGQSTSVEGVRRRLIDAALIFARKHDAGAAREHQPLHAMLLTACETVRVPRTLPAS